MPKQCFLPLLLMLASKPEFDFTKNVGFESLVKNEKPIELFQLLEK